MRINDAIKRTVCFLCVRLPDGSYHIGGTAFFIHIPYEVDPKKNHLFCVTAAHNIEIARAQGYETLYLRINTYDGRADYYQVNREWALPVTDAYHNPDVAVVLLDPLPHWFTPAGIDHQLCATEERMHSRQIGIGDELAIIGLFKKREGREKNIPILRTGTLAAMPEEPIPEGFINEDGEEDVRYFNAYLAEVRSIKGLSGSPVLACIPTNRQIISPNNQDIGRTLDNELYLLGLIRGHWSVDALDVVIDYADEHEDDRINTGIATVTPITDVLTLINGEKLMYERKKKEAEFVKSRPATSDLGFDDLKPESGEGLT